MERKFNSQVALTKVTPMLRENNLKRLRLGYYLEVRVKKRKEKN